MKPGLATTKLFHPIQSNVPRRFPDAKTPRIVPPICENGMRLWKKRLPHIGIVYPIPLVQQSFSFIPRRYYASPFRVSHEEGAEFKVPETLATQRLARDGSTNRPFTYFMVGSTGVLAAMAAKSTVLNFLSSLSASGDVMALSKVEVDLGAIPEGKSVVIKWRGKPIFIRHRTPEEIETAQKVDLGVLRDPQRDEDRVQRAEWIVMLGICTHLGCVPLGESGDYGGWYCPCQYVMRFGLIG